MLRPARWKVKRRKGMRGEYRLNLPPLKRFTQRTPGKLLIVGSFAQPSGEFCAIPGIRGRVFERRKF